MLQLPASVLPGIAGIGVGVGEAGTTPGVGVGFGVGKVRKTAAPPCAPFGVPVHVRPFPSRSSCRAASGWIHAVTNEGKRAIVLRSRRHAAGIA